MVFVSLIALCCLRETDLKMFGEKQIFTIANKQMRESTNLKALSIRPKLSLKWYF